MSTHTGYKDDAATDVVSCHLSGNCLGNIKGSHDIDVQDMPELLRSEIDCGSKVRNTCTGDEPADGIPKTQENFLKCLDDTLIICNVAGEIVQSCTGDFCDISDFLCSKS